jgi:hypothetical protein
MHFKVGAKTPFWNETSHSTETAFNLLTSVTLDPCLAEDGSVRHRVNSPELAPLPVNLES